MLAVEITPRALAQVERAALWWAENRPAAPDAIRLDLAEALEVLAQQPGIGLVVPRGTTLTSVGSISPGPGITSTTA